LFAPQKLETTFTFRHFTNDKHFFVDFFFRTCW